MYNIYCELVYSIVKREIYSLLIECEYMNMVIIYIMPNEWHRPIVPFVFKISCNCNQSYFLYAFIVLSFSGKQTNHPPMDNIIFYQWPLHCNIRCPISKIITSLTYHICIRLIISKCKFQDPSCTVCRFHFT